MLQDELRRRLGDILAEEEEPVVDWGTVSALSAKLISQLVPPAPALVQSYLESVERRRSDPLFAQAQRAELLRYLRTS